jgi:hypothetical protein
VAESVELYITFGVQYAYTPHPTGWNWISPDGYVTIVAPDTQTGRELAFKLFGNAWSFDYDKVPDAEWAPLGELARFSLTVNDLLHLLENGEQGEENSEPPC